MAFISAAIRVSNRVTINFYIAPQCITGERVTGTVIVDGTYIPLASFQRSIEVIMGHINGRNGLVGALEKIPNSHLNVLSTVPIIVVNQSGQGGWVSPGNPDIVGLSKADGYDSWISGRRARRFGEEDNPLPISMASNGLITITSKALLATPHLRQLTVLHEVGHCVDFNLSSSSQSGLESMPENIRYRNGQAAYVGQFYKASHPLHNSKEFKAETYSRLFLATDHMCRGPGKAGPPCSNHSRRGCSRRLQLDLINTRAFRYCTHIPEFNDLVNTPELSHFINSNASLDFLIRSTFDENRDDTISGIIGGSEVSRGATLIRDQQTNSPVGRRSGYILMA